MKTLRLFGRVDERHQLHAEVPPQIAPGTVEFLVVLPAEAEDEAGAEWTTGIAREWATELGDTREDIYTMKDGEPVDGTR